MNRISSKISLALILTCSLFLNSCKKDEETEENVVTETNTPSPSISWSASAGLVSFNADTTTYNYDFDSATGLHVLSAENASGGVMTFMLADITPGNHEVDFDSTIVIWQSGANLYNGGFNPQGFINITDTTNQRITGTFAATLFSFTTATEIEFSSGSFNKLPIFN